MSKSCVFAGTFDPPTVGHTDMVEKALKIFDSVTVALMVNPEKQCLFTENERLDLLQKLFGGNPCIKVRTFHGAAVDLLKEENTVFYVRGVRDGIDLDYENRNHYASKQLMADMITIYLPAEHDDIYVSSSLVRNSIKFKKDYLKYIPSEIADYMEKLMEAKDV